MPSLFWHPLLSSDVGPKIAKAPISNGEFKGTRFAKGFHARISVHGAVAQLGERCVRNAEVEGSIPFRSTNPVHGRQPRPFLLPIPKIPLFSARMAARPGSSVDRA